MTRLGLRLLILLLLPLAGCTDPQPFVFLDVGSPGDAASMADAPDAGPVTPDAGFLSDAARDDAGTDAGPVADASVCIPDCGGRACGPDTCGGTCGSCSGASACMAGVCLDLCPANSSPSGDSCTCDFGYAVGPACGAELVCGRYDYPGICITASASDEIYSLLSSPLRFFGQLRQDCLQLRADVSNGNVEAQAAILVTL